MLYEKGFKPRTSNPTIIKLNLKGKEDRQCSHCKKYGHTKETCFKLHGNEKAINRLVELK